MEVGFLSGHSFLSMNTLDFGCNVLTYQFTCIHMLSYFYHFTVIETVYQNDDKVGGRWVLTGRVDVVAGWDWEVEGQGVCPGGLVHPTCQYPFV